MQNKLQLDKIAKRDLKIIYSGPTDEHWLSMATIERTVFINRVLYNYWESVEKSRQDFWTFKNSIKAEAERIKQEEEEAQRAKEQRSYQRNQSNDWRKSWEDFYYTFSFSATTDAYNTLGVKFGATKSEIRRAYRTLAKIHHPDHGGNQEMFVKVKDAYETLMKEGA